MSTISNLENRVEQLEGEYNSGGDGTEIVITNHVVNEDGSSEVFDETRVWEDSDGWHSERTDYKDVPHPDDDLDIDWGVQ